MMFMWIWICLQNEKEAQWKWKCRDQKILCFGHQSLVWRHKSLKYTDMKLSIKIQRLLFFLLCVSHIIITKPGVNYTQNTISHLILIIS
jgi:hypothetical protein